MIAKHFPMKNQAKSSVGGLVKYLEDKKTNERVADIKINNCVSIETSGAVLEMECVQNINQRAKSDKTFHMVLSCAVEDKVSNEQLQEMAQKMINALGYKEHQSIVVIHDDTDNKHAHIVINKVHPVTYKNITIKSDYKIMSAVCNQLEDEYGLTKVNHQARKTQSERLADDQERHTGIETMLNWIKRECLDDLKQATTWKEFNNTLDEHGLYIRVKANGFVISDHNMREVKASSVAREFSKPNLEKKFGTFVTEERKHKPKPKKQYIEKPLSRGYDTTELYALYKKQQANAVSVRQQTMAMAKERKASQIKAAKHSAKAKREALKLMSISRDAKKVLYKTISNSLLKRISNINKDYKNSTNLIYNRCKQQSWADWLRAQAMAGNAEAVKALRARSYKSNLVCNTITGHGRSDYVSPRRDSITKEGVVIYSSKYFSIRDDGKHIKVSRGVSHDGVTAALKVAIAKYGEVIKVDGDQAFKEQVVIAAAVSGIKVKFEDAALNQQLTEIKERYKNELKDRGRNSGSFGKPSGQRRYAAGTERGMAGGGRKKATPKPNTVKYPEPPPTKRHNGMRELRDVVMAFDSRRTEVLLQSNAPNNLDNTESRHNGVVRRQPTGKKR